MTASQGWLLGPGLGPGVTFVDPGDVAVSHNGDMAARSVIQGPGVTRENEEIVWSLGQNNTRRIVTRTGDEVMVDQVTSAPITDLGRTRVAADGTVLFFARINDDVPGIWQQEEPGATIRPRILADTDGDLGPGLGPDVAFRSFSQPSATANGDFSVFARLQMPLDSNDATTDRGIWSVPRDSRPRLIARIGQDIPSNAGLGNGFKLLGVGDSIATEFGILFGGRLDGPKVNGDNDSALFIALEDQMRLVLRKGDTVDVDTGAGIDLRRIVEIDVPDFFEGDGRPHVFNEHAQFVVKLRFDDGNSGLFTVTVPEPAAVTHALLGAILGGCVALIQSRRIPRTA